MRMMPQGEDEDSEESEEDSEEEGEGEDSEEDDEDGTTNAGGQQQHNSVVIPRGSGGGGKVFRLSNQGGKLLRPQLVDGVISLSWTTQQDDDDNDNHDNDTDEDDDNDSESDESDTNEPPPTPRPQQTIQPMYHAAGGGKSLSHMQHPKQHPPTISSEEEEAKLGMNSDKEQEFRACFKRFRENVAADSCPICCEEKPNIITVCCGKGACITCMATWLSKKESCPQCRAQISFNPVSSNPSETIVDNLTTTAQTISELSRNRTVEAIFDSPPASLTRFRIMQFQVDLNTRLDAFLQRLRSREAKIDDDSPPASVSRLPTHLVMLSQRNCREKHLRPLRNNRPSRRTTSNTQPLRHRRGFQRRGKR